MSHQISVHVEYWWVSFLSFSIFFSCLLCLSYLSVLCDAGTICNIFLYIVVCQPYWHPNRQRAFRKCSFVVMGYVMKVLWQDHTFVIKCTLNALWLIYTYEARLPSLYFLVVSWLWLFVWIFSGGWGYGQRFQALKDAIIENVPEAMVTGTVGRKSE